MFIIDSVPVRFNSVVNAACMYASMRASLISVCAIMRVFAILFVRVSACEGAMSEQLNAPY
jgi:hypothetical protein